MAAGEDGARHAHERRGAAAAGPGAARIASMVVAGICFCALLAWVKATGVTPLDNAVMGLAVSVRTQGLTKFLEQVTTLAVPVAMFAVSVPAAAFAPVRRGWLCMMVNIAGSAAFNFLLKLLVMRPRPDEALRLVVESSYSFPSGHTMAVASFYGLLVWMIWHFGHNRRARNVWTACLALVMAGVGMSRVYLGVHYPTDVLAGYCEALVWLGAYTWLVAPRMLEDERGERPAGPAAP